jgi:NAD(P)-dependent dehydrogenase (short-subunit alcohol dehydrogenase family)
MLARSVAPSQLLPSVLVHASSLPDLSFTRKSGLILTLGSFSALVPSAMLATYTGAKAFLERWSQALGEETKEFGVDVRLVLPYFVVRPQPHPPLLFLSLLDSVRLTSVSAHPSPCFVAGLQHVQDPSLVAAHPDPSRVRLGHARVGRTGTRSWR